jgi:hypothetical protein
LRLNEQGGSERLGRIVFEFPSTFGVSPPPSIPSAMQDKTYETYRTNQVKTQDKEDKRREDNTHHGTHTMRRVQTTTRQDTRRDKASQKKTRHNRRRQGQKKGYLAWYFVH